MKTKTGLLGSKGTPLFNDLLILKANGLRANKLEEVVK